MFPSGSRVGSLPATAEAKRLLALNLLAEKVYLYREAINEPSRGMGAKVFWAKDAMLRALKELEEL